MQFNDKVTEILKEIIYVLRTIVVCSVAVFIWTSLLFSPVYIEGSSMYPSLEDNDFGFSFVLGSLLDRYERFDVVVTLYEKSNQLWVKRIIGLPGETLEYDDDTLYINGKAVDEYFLNDDYVNNQTFGGTLNFTTNFGPIVLGEDEFFLMGDNRLVSQDSRTSGAFNSSDFISKNVFVLYPFKNLGMTKNN